jgi:hypothetical protein
MPDPSKKSYRFIGDDIDKLIARLQKSQTSRVDDPEARRAVKTAVAQLKALRRTIRKDLFLPTWFIGR